MKFTRPSIKNLIEKFARETECSNISCGTNEKRNESLRECENTCPYRTPISKENATTQNNSQLNCRGEDKNRDFGNAPYAFDIRDATNKNTDFRAALWTGKHLQLTVMSIPVGEDSGTEMHDDLDQFLKIESGTGKIEMGRLKNNMNYKSDLYPGYAVLVPAGTYHNLINTGRSPLKLYSIYTPKGHPFGTVDATKEDAAKREEQAAKN